MLDYGKFPHGRFAPGLGDASVKIRSGRIQPGTPPPSAAETPVAFRDICVAWGYPAPEPERDPVTASDLGQSVVKPRQAADEASTLADEATDGAAR
jgi:hypothetical protein